MLIYLKKIYIIGFILIAFVACKKENLTPAYIKINDIELNNSSTDKITDAWVYIENQLQGVYELPAKFPLLETGVKEIRIKAGIKNNGISSSRVFYPFYSSFIINNFELISGEEYTINPVVNYLDNISIFNEDFEGVGLEIDTTINSNIDFEIVNDSAQKYAFANLKDSNSIFEIATIEILDIPKDGSPVFLELDYKSNTEFKTGLYVQESGTVIDESILWIREKETWSKIYVNLTPVTSNYFNASSFKLYLKMERNFSISENKIYFDNLKIVY